MKPKEIIKVLEPFIDFPKEDLQEWIDYGQPITITVLPKHLENVMTSIEELKKTI